MNNYIEIFAFIGAVFALFGFVAGFYLAFKELCLRRYLHNNKHERYDELTSIDTKWGRIGPGGAYGLKEYRYVKSNLDDEDKEILKMKISLRINIKYMLRFFIISFASFFIMIVLSL